ncbi:MAG: hypothetical protein A2V98_08200 [Planctomycetes bacterium RBG_16_64_12]|nr:MAG: hypothetical protein A2V98_08200 [Planctomycetes bacterium RBG_16_64_12]
MLDVFIVSDATGKTAERVVRAALVQFEDAPVRVVRRENIRTPEEVRAVVEEAAGEDSILVHTLVSDRLRRLMLAESRLRGIDSLDMLGPVLDRLATHLKLTPQEKPGLFKQLQEAKSREIEAVAFAFRHDDGQKAEELDRAEVVLVGVSRSMKTPVMLYLAYRGWFAANVPLIPEIDPPPTLLSLPADRVFCLDVAPDRLQQLRRVRAASEAIPVDPYASSEQIRKEIHHAQQECLKHRWRSIDVTGKSVEEVCRELIALLPAERRAHGPTG